MKTTAIILIMMAIVSCGKKKSSSTTGALTPALSGIQGTWKSDCSDNGNGTSQQTAFIVTSTTLHWVGSSFATTNCTVGTERYKNDQEFDLNYDAATEMMDLVTVKVLHTFWDATLLTSVNNPTDNGDTCGAKDWQSGVAKDITGISPCGWQTFPAGVALSQLPFNKVNDNTYDFSGSIFYRQ